MTAPLSFLAGLYVGLRALAALHRVRDLWGVPGTRWPRVVGGVLLWCGLAAAGGLRSTTLLAGVGAFVAGQAVAWAVAIAVLEVAARRPGLRSPGRSAKG